MSVTSTPFWRAEAATSEPIQPAPITTTRAACASRSRERVGVGEVAQVVDAVEVGARAASSRRGSAPVASSSRS